jgi:KaiC/GvpD/RAD55 family RecA-like ATPase
MQFKRAQRSQRHLRMAISGPSGSGKTWTALTIATGLGGRIAFIDTERNSSVMYADDFTFDVLALDPPYHPDRLGEALKAASGYDVAIVDSLTHFWSGPGGMLEVVDAIAKRSQAKNTFAAWNEGTPIQQRMVSAMLDHDGHIIATMRSKQEYGTEKDDKGRLSVRKLGLAPQQRDGLEYEFDIFVEMDMEHTLTVSKTRIRDFTDAVLRRPGVEVGAKLRAWHADGALVVADEWREKLAAYELDDRISEAQRAWIGEQLAAGIAGSKAEKVVSRIAETLAGSVVQ